VRQRVEGRHRESGWDGIFAAIDMRIIMDLIIRIFFIDREPVIY